MTENPCEADLVRRQRALQGAELISRDGPMERRITFEVGYDHRAHPEACGGGGHGQHGMTLRFVLLGPAGATQWVVNLTNWVPGNVTTIGDVNAEHRISAIPVQRHSRDGMPVDLGYHSPKPMYDGHEEYGRMDCAILPEGYCYYDGSGCNAGPVLEAFLAHGPMAVWAALARYYQDLFGEKAALDG